MSATVEAAALAYAARGWPVFPCKATSDKAAGSKAPHLPGETSPGAKDGGHWLASTDRSRILDWWRRWPDALIGLPTGRRSGTVVVDIDPREHDFATMLDALTSWCGHLRHEDADTGEIIEPAIAITQSGGLHLYFAWPDEAGFAVIARGLARVGQAATGSIGNRTNLFRAFLPDEAPAQLSHVDVRAEGGYVIAPPSIMSNGRAYEWLVPPEATLPPLPRRLRGIITGEFQSERQKRERAAFEGKRQRFSGGEISDDRVRRYVEQTIRGVLNTAASAGEGNRNAAVFWAACRLGEFVRGGMLPAGEAETLLLGHLPAGVSAGEKKIRTTIRNGLANADTPAFSADQLDAGRGAR